MRAGAVHGGAWASTAVGRARPSARNLTAVPARFHDREVARGWWAGVGMLGLVAGRPGADPTPGAERHRSTTNRLRPGDGRPRVALGR
ncbi:hypothetical protein ACFPM0_05740 [Pseudonocardia sulfidoxydans]|uniref:hypothetical protein n=1 Tax=Pseudonocardia sulfidoxydans TaxID=54011 RepID=UPI0036173A56